MLKSTFFYDSIEKKGDFMKNIYDFYSKNLNKLDEEWKKFCFTTNRDIKDAGDFYYNEEMFWVFVEDQYLAFQNN
jgi:hypothetical protein